VSGNDGSAARGGAFVGIDRRAFLLALGTFAVGTDAFIIAGVLPEISTSLSSSLGAAGLVVSVFSVSYAFGSPVVSSLSARWRRSTVLIGGLGVFTLANLLSAASPTLVNLLASRVLAAFRGPCRASLLRAGVNFWYAAQSGETSRGRSRGLHQRNGSGCTLRRLSRQI
jgi:MFS transporter, DHA1 family, inner membrane transport protein